MCNGLIFFFLVAMFSCTFVQRTVLLVSWFAYCGSIYDLVSKVSVGIGLTLGAVANLYQKSLVVPTSVSLTACDLSNLTLSHNRYTQLYLQLDDSSIRLDYLVQRRLAITAQYDLRCSLLGDNVVRSTVQVTANSHSAGLISTICGQGKYTGWLRNSPYSFLTAWASILTFIARNRTSFSM